jgi:adenosine deaminase
MLESQPHHRAIDPELQQFCLSLPKIELHAHLGGSVRNSSLLRKLQENGVADAATIAQRCLINGIDDKRTMTEQMEMFDIVSSAFPTANDKKQVAIEYIEDCVKDNVVYLELRTSGAEVSKYDAVFAAFEECRQRQLPVITRMIASVQRSWNFEKAEQAIKLAVQNKNRGVVAVDFCGDPRSGQFGPFQSLFQYAQREGLRFTSHFAESPNETDLDCILDCHPDRLGHCSYLHQNKPVQKRVFEARIPIEACLASNINTMRLYGGLTEHPVVGWLQDNHPVVPCTDNAGLLNCTLSDHYSMLAHDCQRSSCGTLQNQPVTTYLRQMLRMNFEESFGISIKKWSQRKINKSCV